METTSKRFNLQKPHYFILIGIIVFLFGAINYYRIRVLSFSKTPPMSTQTSTDIDIPAELIIPSINLDVRVEPGNIYDGVWQISKSGASFLTSSAPPGSIGNTVIYGHNLKRIFGNIPFIKVGEKIIIKTVTGQIYNYTVEQKLEVKPNRVDLISPSSNAELTLYTCSGIFDSYRTVIKAKPQAN